MTVPWWKRSHEPETVETAVAVVGGGIAGISAALFLQDRGLDAVLLERDTLGSGASTRNAGFLMRGAADNYAVAIDRFGRDLARVAWRLSEENLTLLRARGIAAVRSYHDTPSCLLAYEPVEAGELTRSRSLLEQDGFTVEWLEPGSPGADDAAWAASRPTLGLVNPNDGRVNPADMIAYLASILRIPVVERQEVVEISPSPRGVTIRTPALTVLAEHAIICTNAYAPLLLPQLANLVTPRRGQMLAIRAPGVRLDRCYYANRGYEYFRPAGEGVIVVGGKRRSAAGAEVGYDDRTTPGVQHAIEEFAMATLGLDHLEVIARWSGVMGFSADDLPLIGPIPGVERAWFCGGFTGHGMSLAHRCAKAAVDSMLDGADNPLPLARLTASR